MDGKQPKARVIFECIPCADLDARLAQMYNLAILRYNQSKLKIQETANDEGIASTYAVLTPNADLRGEEADC